MYAFAPKTASSGESNGVKVQPKLTIGGAENEYEQEADRVARQVMLMPGPERRSSCACGGGCPACLAKPASRENGRLRLKRVRMGDTGEIAAPPIVNEVLRSPGRPLDTATRAFMEPRFGYDFSRVRVHSGPQAELSAADVNARAYTAGLNIVFGAGKFAPETPEGRSLLAHELTHVVQQSGPDETNAQNDGPTGQNSPDTIARSVNISAGAGAILQRSPTDEDDGQSARVKAIEKQLSFRTFDPDDQRLLDRRNTLTLQFNSLPEDDADVLVASLFEPAGANPVAAGFQKLHTSTRTRLLKILFGRLGHTAAENLHASLTATEPKSWETRLQSRLKELLPPGNRGQALELLGSRFQPRHTPAGTSLWVHLDETGFRASGTTNTSNHCKNCPADLGESSWQNAMELRGDIAGNASGAGLDFKRTIEGATWKKVGPFWKSLWYLPPDSPDDRHNDDEDLKGDFGHIFVIDRPGPVYYGASTDPFSPTDKNATGYVYMATFVEWVENAAGQKVSDDFYWHSVTTLEKVNGKWQRDPAGTNEIAPGTIPILSPDGQKP